MAGVPTDPAHVAQLLATGAGTRPAPQSLAILLDQELEGLDAATRQAVVGFLTLLPDGFENHVLEEVRQNLDPDEKAEPLSVSPRKEVEVPEPVLLRRAVATISATSRAVGKTAAR